MSALRAATSREHQELEDRVAVTEQLESSESYQRMLEAFYGFVKPFEAALAQWDWQRAGIDFSERRKAALLEQDLQTLGTNPAEVAECGELPEFSTLAEACGALYVMEGSTLGGQQITRLAEKAGVDDAATNYFRSYGPRVGEMWKSFGAAVNRFAENAGNEDAIIEGARRTFRALQAWFESRLVAR
jgi:heme oxygenase